MAKPTRQEPIVLQSTRGEHARAFRERVLEIAHLDTGDCYEGYTYSASIKIFHRTCYATLFCFCDGDNVLLTVMESIYHRYFSP